MAIRWNEIQVLRALDELEREDGACAIDGEQLLRIVAGDEPPTNPDRSSLTGLLYALSQQRLLSFEIKSSPRIPGPATEDPRHLQRLWRFRLTDTGRDRTRTRTALQRPAEPGQDDGRPIPGAALDQFAQAIAAWYAPGQLSKFLDDSGLPPIHDVQARGSTEDLSANLAAYGRGNREQRGKLRRFLAAFLNDDLDPFPDRDQHDQLIDTLAAAGWHLRDDHLVIGERLIPAKPRATPATPDALALERDEAIARARESERERDLALQLGRASDAARRAAAQEAARARQDAEGVAQEALARAQTAVAAQAVAEAVASEAGQRAQQAVARAERAEWERGEAIARAERAEWERGEAIARADEAERERGEAERERDLALELGRASEAAREAAEHEAERACQDAERAEQHARSERAELECELGKQREARAALDLERDRAQAALEGEQRLRAQLQADLEGERRLRAQPRVDLETGQRRLEEAEKARDAGAAADQRAATRRGAPRRKT
ncbi:MAG: hypothetical protein ACLP01_20990 [Solirubrobacteraceae bacterium]